MAVKRGKAKAGRKAGLKSAEKSVDRMFSGSKAALRPLYDRLLELGVTLGPDVTAAPGRVAVALRRRAVFGQIKPATATRIDLGLALGKVKATKRLIKVGGAGKGGGITHRVPISLPAGIDAEVRRWLRAAYERAG